jgi:hypothetical protein
MNSLRARHLSPILYISPGIQWHFQGTTREHTYRVLSAACRPVHFPVQTLCLAGKWRSETIKIYTQSLSQMVEECAWISTSDLRIASKSQQKVFSVSPEVWWHHVCISMGIYGPDGARWVTGENENKSQVEWSQGHLAWFMMRRFGGSIMTFTQYL